MISIIFLVSHLLTDQNLITTLAEVVIFTYRVFIESASFYTHEAMTRKKFKMTANATEGFDKAANVDSSEPKTEVEEIIDCLTECLNFANLMIAEYSGTSKNRILRIHELIHKVISKIREKPNICSADMEMLTKDLDEEEKIYIKQTQNDDIKPLSIIRPRNKLRIRKTDEIALNYIAYDIEDLIGVLKQVGKNWNFDMFFLKDCTRNKPLATIGKYCIGKFRLDEILNLRETVYANYFHDLESLYKLDNPYHNSTHAADVLASFMFFINQTVLSELFTEYDILAVIIAALGHDVGHPGFTNRFLIINRDSLANQYNDCSVLEMMHCASTFSIMKGQDSDILSTLDSEHYTSVRKLIVEMILSTDMSRHWDLLAQFKAKGHKAPDHFETLDQRIDILRMAMKAADVAHAAKSIELHHK